MSDGGEEIIACRDPENCRTVTLAECQVVDREYSELRQYWDTPEKAAEKVIIYFRDGFVGRQWHGCLHNIPWNPAWLVLTSEKMDHHTPIKIDYTVRYIDSSSKWDGHLYRVPSLAKAAQRPGTV